MAFLAMGTVLVLAATADAQLAVPDSIVRTAPSVWSDTHLTRLPPAQPGARVFPLAAAEAAFDSPPVPAAEPITPVETLGNNPDATVDTTGDGQACDSCSLGDSLSCTGACSPWFATVGAVVMTRDDGDHFQFSFDDTDESIQLLDTRDSAMNWAGGVDVRVGRYFDCGRLALEGTYWQIFPEDQQQTLFGGPLGGNLNGILNWNQLNYNGASADTWVNAAVAHRLRRSYDFRNVEINLLGSAGETPLSSYGSSGAPWLFRWSTGVRYFRFDEGLQFASDTNDGVFSGAADEIYYDVDIENHLVGWQLGGQLRFRPWNRLSILLGSKAGIYGNHIEHYSRIGGAAGDAVVNNGPNNGRAFRHRGTKNDVSFLAELNAGIDYRIRPRWLIGIGYRAFAVTGVALAADQIPRDLRGVNDLPVVASDGSVVLHGGYANITFLY